MSTIDERYLRGSVWTVPFAYEDTFRGAIQAAAPGQSGRSLTGARKENCWMILLSTNQRFVKLVACSTLVPARRKTAEDDASVVIFSQDDEGGWEAFECAAECSDPLRYPLHKFKGAANYKGRISEEKMREVDVAICKGLELGQY